MTKILENLCGADCFYKGVCNLILMLCQAIRRVQVGDGDENTDKSTTIPGKIISIRCP